MDEQTYQIVLSPDFGISPEEFARAWNEMSQARAIAEARLVESKGTQFDPHARRRHPDRRGDQCCQQRPLRPHQRGHPAATRPAECAPTYTHAH